MYVSTRKPGCTGKKRHPTADQAVLNAFRVILKHGPQRAYECRHCKGWHLTSKPLRKGSLAP